MRALPPADAAEAGVAAEEQEGEAAGGEEQEGEAAGGEVVEAAAAGGEEQEEEAAGGEEQEGEAAGGEVAQASYVAVHMRINKATREARPGEAGAGEAAFDAGAAAAAAREDWAHDITQFSAASSVLVWLAEVPKGKRRGGRVGLALAPPPPSRRPPLGR
jgi:hypothetical protein